MKAKKVIGLSSVLFVSVACVSACSGSDAHETVGTQKQALANGCRLPTVGAACDPDGDGPATACDGICVVDGAKDNEPDCMPVRSVVNEGMPCGGLLENKVECTRSCRQGVCTTNAANDESPCMPSGSPYYSAVCEGACNAGSCMKLAKPKNCPVATDPGEADTGASSSDDTGASSSDDTGASGSDDTGASGSADTGGGGSGANGGSHGTLGPNVPVVTNTPVMPPLANIDAGVTTTTPPEPLGSAADASPVDTGGCGCRTAGSTTSAAPVFGSLLAALVIAMRRRRQ